MRLMAVFSYKAISSTGKRLQGVIDAFDLLEAKEKLRQQGCTPLVLVPTKPKKAASIQKLTQTQLVFFTAQLAQLIKAKIPLHDCLIALEEQLRGDPSHSIIEALADRIKKGQSFSKALQEFSESFPPLFRAAVAAGETAGSLELTLNRLATFYLQQQQTQKQLVSALIYPCTLVGLLFIALTILLGFVIPSLEGLLEGKELPVTTTMLIGLSHLFQQTWPYIVVAIASLIVITKYVLQQKQFNSWKLLLSKLFLSKIPIISTFTISTNLARFSSTLSMLLDGGVPLASALELAQQTIHHPQLERSIERAKNRLLEGSRLSFELGRVKEIPPLFSRMVQIGEETGRMAELVEQVGSMYDQESKRILERSLTLLQPIVLILMGIMIGVVLLSILMPLSDIGGGIDVYAG